MQLAKVKVKRNFFKKPTPSSCCRSKSFWMKKKGHCSGNINLMIKNLGCRLTVCSQGTSVDRTGAQSPKDFLQNSKQTKSEESRETALKRDKSSDGRYD